MAWTPIVLVCLHYCLGVTPQAPIAQLASQSVSLGQTAKISCSKSSAGNWHSYFLWYQQRTGQSPHFVIHGTGNRGDGIPDRFTGSSSGNVGYLTITNVQPEDEADYYCTAVEYAGSFKFHAFWMEVQTADRKEQVVKQKAT